MHKKGECDDIFPQKLKSTTVSTTSLQNAPLLNENSSSSRAEIRQPTIKFTTSTPKLEKPVSATLRSGKERTVIPKTESNVMKSVGEVFKRMITKIFK